jgi:hypothetical protein
MNGAKSESRAMSDSRSEQTHPVCTANRHMAALEMLRGSLCPHGGTKPLKLRELAKRLNLNPGYLSQVLRGKRAPSRKVYAALGLPPPARVVEVGEGFDVAPVCSKCGIVHTTKRCTKGKTTKPRAKAYKLDGRRYCRHEGTDQI